MRIIKNYTTNVYLLIVLSFVFLIPTIYSKKESINYSIRSYKHSNYNYVKQTNHKFKKIYYELKTRTNSGVYWRGSPVYNQRRIMENGLCNNMFPELIVAPKSTEDVATIVKISRKYKIPISVRSGGHS